MYGWWRQKPERQMATDRNIQMRKRNSLVYTRSVVMVVCHNIRKELGVLFCLMLLGIWPVSHPCSITKLLSKPCMVFLTPKLLGKFCGNTAAHSCPASLSKWVNVSYDPAGYSGVHFSHAGYCLTDSGEEDNGTS